MNGKPITSADIAYIRKHYANTPTATIARHLGRGISTVYHLAHKHGIYKSVEYRTVHGGCFAPGFKGGNATAFQPGHKPHNTGKKMTADTYAKVQRSMFKKGHLPHNTKKQGDGATSTRTDKIGNTYKFIRIALGKWVPLHQHLWWQANGTYNTSAHCLWFINRNTLDVRLDNLELITRAENAKRNASKYHALTDELKQTNKLIKQINSKIYASNKM
jgi:HNH endonuclease